MDNKFLWIFDNFFSALPTIKNWGKFRGQASKLNYNVARNYIFYPMLEKFRGQATNIIEIYKI